MSEHFATKTENHGYIGQTQSHLMLVPTLVRTWHGNWGKWGSTIERNTFEHACESKPIRSTKSIRIPKTAQLYV